MNNTEVFRFKRDKEKIGQKCLCVVGTLYVHYIMIFDFFIVELVLKNSIPQERYLFAVQILRQLIWHTNKDGTSVNLLMSIWDVYYQRDNLCTYFKGTWIIQNESKFYFYPSYIIIGNKINLCSWKKWDPEFNVSPFYNITNNCKCLHWKIEVSFRLNSLGPFIYYVSKRTGKWPAFTFINVFLLT